MLQKLPTCLRGGSWVPSPEIQIAYFQLVCGVLFELLGCTLMKLSKGLTQIRLAILAISCMGLSFCLFGLAVDNLELSLTYSIWCATGITAMCFIGMLKFDEKFTPLKVCSIASIVVGVTGLQFAGVEY